jgi:hypothetical protein
MNANTKEKLGKFYISRICLNNWRQLLGLFSRMVVVRCECHYARDQMEYIAYSDLFEEIELGEAIPEYNFVFDSKTDVITVERISP